MAVKLNKPVTIKFYHTADNTLYSEDDWRDLGEFNQPDDYEVIEIPEIVWNYIYGCGYSDAHFHKPKSAY